MCFIAFWGGGTQVWAQSSAPEQLVNRVLAKADKAFAARRYTQPQHNNAFDRYNAVLMIDPDNTRAKHGLKLVRNAYILMADDELATGSSAHARRFLAILQDLYPQDREVAKLQQRIRRHKQQQEPVVLDVANLLVKEFVLDERGLTARNAAMKTSIERIADRVAETREAVLIIARNDGEGRWIYQTMNKATPEYRVRGDIRIDRRPAIQLLEPL